MKEFTCWLENKKGFSHKSAQDVCSRLRRIVILSNKTDINSIKSLDFETNNTFQSLSLTVKSQLRRAYKLYQEYSQ